MYRGKEGGIDGRLEPAGPASIVISARFVGLIVKDVSVEVFVMLIVLVGLDVLLPIKG